MKRKSYIYLIALLSSLSLVLSAPVVRATSVKEEIDIGQKAAKDIEKRFPVTENKAWLTEIDRLGHLLTPYVSRKDIPYSFKIIKEQTDGVNELDAFSLPGGPVYFSERMWRILTRNERIGVLAHEIAHVDKRHAIDTINEMNKRSILATIILVIVQANNNWWNAADLGNTIYTLKYSRKREKEADMMGIDTCLAAGQSPAGLETTMKKLLRIEDENGGSPPRILATHPATKVRVEYLTKRCLEVGVKAADLDPKYPDGPDRIGSVVSKGKKKKKFIVTVDATRELKQDESIWIKKPLWDDEKNAVVPQPIARGTVSTPGIKAAIVVTKEPGFEFEDIEIGGGIYPRAPEAVSEPPKPSTGN